MKELIAKYKLRMNAGYSRVEVKEMLDNENLSPLQRRLIIETVFGIPGRKQVRVCDLNTGDRFIRNEIEYKVFSKDPETLMFYSVNNPGKKMCFGSKSKERVYLITD